MTNYSNYMQFALEQAQYAFDQGEVPVGAVVVYNQEIVGKGFNCPISSKDPTAHAEVMALRDAAKKLNNYRLVDCDLYVTLEPCTMCLGALTHARIRTLIYGASEPKSGVIESQNKLHQAPYLNHAIEVVGGVLKEQCSILLSQFFQQRRQQKLIK